jgi:ComF family protein
VSILPQNKGLQGAADKRWRRIGRPLAHVCLLCAASSGEVIVCTACAADLPRLQAPGCVRCARPRPGASVDNEICGRCLADAPHYDRTLAAFRYDFPLDKLVQSFKYGHRLALAAYFGEQLAALAGRPQADLLVPLPLHSERLRDRGFNQALELARPVSAAWQLPIDATSCQRVRNTPAQADLPWRGRIKNMRGAFHCCADFTGKRIVLIDDVMTSGATLDECARTLKLHGAVDVTALVLARAVVKSD